MKDPLPQNIIIQAHDYGCQFREIFERLECLGGRIERMEERIVSSLKGVSLEEARRITADLRASSDKVEQAIKANTPKEN